MAIANNPDAKSAYDKLAADPEFKKATELVAMLQKIPPQSEMVYTALLGTAVTAANVDLQTVVAKLTIVVAKLLVQLNEAKAALEAKS